VGGLSRHLAWACLTLAYLFVFPYFARLNNPNENVRVWTTRALALHGTFAIDQIEREWGPVSDRAVFAGHHYSSKAPGTSLLGMPVAFLQAKLWALAGAGSPSPRMTTYALRVFAVALPLAVFFWIFGRAVSDDLVLVGLGLGTMMYPYGLLFVGHALSAALLFTGFLALRDRRPVLAGVLAGLAVVFEYQALFAVTVVAGYALWRERRRAWPFFAGALGPALLLAAYHTALFGRPWESPLAHADDPIFLQYHQQGALLGLGLPRPSVLLSALFGTDNGLFVYSPFLLLGLAAAVWLAVRPSPERGEGVLIVAVTAVMLLFLAGVANWRAGWSAAGPRYVCTVVPFLAWGVSLGWRRVAHPLARGAAAGLLVASVVLCVLAGAHFPHFPLQFDNPIFDLTLPFIAEGHVPYSLGWLLGLRGALSYLPLALVVVVALGDGLRGRTAAVGGLAALLVAGLYLGGLSLVGRRSHPDEEHARQVVRAVWEPDGPR
jgi:hypothetical protein